MVTAPTRPTRVPTGIPNRVGTLRTRFRLGGDSRPGEVADFGEVAPVRGGLTVNAG
jgi:hypothetical protein